MLLVLPRCFSNILFALSISAFATPFFSFIRRSLPSIFSFIDAFRVCRIFCNLGKGELDELDMIVKSVLRREGFHGRQSSDEILYLKRSEGGRGLKSFKEVYDETKTRVACYMAAATNEWIRVAWRNESRKEEISLKKEAENAMRKVEVTVSFDEGSVIIGEESHTEWILSWKKLKKILIEGQKRNKQQSLVEKELQSEIPKPYIEEDSDWLKCNTDPRKTSSIFMLKEQMVETRA